MFEVETYKRFLALLDNYSRETGVEEVVTAEELREDAAFLQAIMRTKPMQVGRLCTRVASVPFAVVVDPVHSHQAVSHVDLHTHHACPGVLAHGRGCERVCIVTVDVASPCVASTYTRTSSKSTSRNRTSQPSSGSWIHCGSRCIDGERPDRSSVLWGLVLPRACAP